MKHALASVVFFLVVAGCEGPTGPEGRVEPGTIEAIDVAYSQATPPGGLITTVQGALDTQAVVSDSALQIASAALPRVQTVGSATYPLAALHCGVTANTDAGVGGYLGANTLCQAVAGCGANSHVCTREEVLRSYVLGSSPAPVTGWVSLGPLADCDGFTSATGLTGTKWNSLGTKMFFDADCAVATDPILCCK